MKCFAGQVLEMFSADFFRLRKRNIFLVAIIALLFVLLLPTLVRFYGGNSSFIGSEAYYHYRVADRLVKLGLLNMFSPPADVPDLVYQERDYVFTPFHYLLAYAARFVSLAGALRIVPLLLGILSVLVFSLILRRFVVKDYHRHLVLLLLVINPAFIYTFTVPTPHAAAILFSLLGFYFFISRRFFWLSLVFFGLVSFFSLFNVLLVLLLLLAYTLSARKRYNRLIISFLVLLGLSLTHRLSLFYNYTYAPSANVFGNLLSDLGGIVGFGIFTVVLAVYGVFSNWEKKQRFLFFFILSLLLALSLFLVGNIANMYLAFFVAVAAAAGFVRLYESGWVVADLRNLTVLVIVCGLLFSCMSYLGRLAEMPPDDSVIESMVWMGDSTFKDGFVLSHYGNGYMISTVARNPVFSDAFSTASYDQQFLYKIQDSMFSTRRLNDAKRLFSAYNIHYIYVDEEMRSGEVWRRDDEGLLFLFTNAETFEKVYSRDGIEIWEVKNTTIKN